MQVKWWVYRVLTKTWWWSAIHRTTHEKLTDVFHASFSIFRFGHMREEFPSAQVQVRVNCMFFPSSTAPSPERLPLCLLRDLSKLAFTSLLGLACDPWPNFVKKTNFSWSKPVDGSEILLPVDMENLPSFTGFYCIYLRWCRISFINSMVLLFTLIFVCFSLGVGVRGWFPQQMMVPNHLWSVACCYFRGEKDWRFFAWANMMQRCPLHTLPAIQLWKVGGRWFLVS